MRRRIQGRKRVTLSAAIDMVREVGRKSDISPNTAKWYEEQFALFIGAWEGSVLLDEFTEAEVEWFIDRRREQWIGVNSILHQLRALTRLFNVALPRQPCWARTPGQHHWGLPTPSGSRQHPSRTT